MTKSNKTTVITLLVMLVIAAAVFFGYYQMTSNPKEEEVTVAKTEVDKLLQKDMEGNYPGTPREVMKFHGRITQCIYNEDLKKSQLEGLLEQARKLYDDELLAQNPWDAHLESLMSDIKDYNENERTIMSYTVQNSSQIKTHKVDGQEYAIAYMLFILSDKTTPMIKSCEKFMLRTDDKGKWKIVGWELADPESAEFGNE